MSLGRAMTLNAPGSASEFIPIGTGVKFHLFPHRVAAPLGRGLEAGASPLIFEWVRTNRRQCGQPSTKICTLKILKDAG